MTYAAGTFLVPILIPKWVEYRVTLILSLLMLAVSTALIGPFIGGPDIVLMLIGLAFSGFFTGFLCIPNMPEMMEATAVMFPDSDLEHANDLLSGLLMAIFGVGQALGPLLGSFLYQTTDFVTC